MKLLKNGNVYDVIKGEILHGYDILIDDKIVEIGKNIEADCEIIDVTDKHILPGLIDAHTHLGLYEEGIRFEGADGNEAVDPVTPHLKAIDAINPMDEGFNDARKYGITTVATGPGSANVIGGKFAIIKTSGDNVDKMIIKDDCAMKIAFGENPKRVYHDQKKSPSTRMATAAILRETIEKAIRYERKLVNAEGDFSKEPEYNAKLHALIPVLRKEIPLKAHAHRADDILTAIRIAKEYDLDMTLEHCTEGYLISDYVKESSFPAICGPLLTNRSKYELKNRDLILPKVLDDKGVKVAITTDFPVIPFSQLIISAALCHKYGMNKFNALRSITINPAEILNISDEVGSLNIGKKADIIIFDDEPFNITSKNIYTISEGKIVYSEE